MAEKSEPTFLGDTEFKEKKKDIRGEYVSMFGEPFYKIENYDAMPPFFMSIVSSSDHWLFLASTGGLTAAVSAPSRLSFRTMRWIRSQRTMRIPAIRPSCSSGVPSAPIYGTLFRAGLGQLFHPTQSL